MGASKVKMHFNSFSRKYEKRRRGGERDFRKSSLVCRLGLHPVGAGRMTAGEKQNICGSGLGGQSRGSPLLKGAPLEEPSNRNKSRFTLQTWTWQPQSSEQERAFPLMGKQDRPALHTAGPSPLCVFTARGLGRACPDQGQ